MRYITLNNQTKNLKDWGEYFKTSPQGVSYWLAHYPPDEVYRRGMARRRQPQHYRYTRIKIHWKGKIYNGAEFAKHHGVAPMTFWRWVKDHGVKVAVSKAQAHETIPRESPKWITFKRKKKNLTGWAKHYDVDLGQLSREVKAHGAEAALARIDQRRRKKA